MVLGEGRGAPGGHGMPDIVVGPGGNWGGAGVPRGLGGPDGPPLRCRCPGWFPPPPSLHIFTLTPTHQAVLDMGFMDNSKYVKEPQSVSAIHNLTCTLIHCTQFSLPLKGEQTVMDGLTTLVS